MKTKSDFIQEVKTRVILLDLGLASQKTSLNSDKTTLSHRHRHTEILLDRTSCITGCAALGVHSEGQSADEMATAVSKTGHNTHLLPSGHFETEK